MLSTVFVYKYLFSFILLISLESLQNGMILAVIRFALIPLIMV